MGDNVHFIFIHDLVDPKTGKTYREMNLELKHQFPIGSLVEIDGYSRLFIVAHRRDCDGTPLYSMNHIPAHPDAYQGRQDIHGYPEHALKLILDKDEVNWKEEWED